MRNRHLPDAAALWPNGRGGPPSAFPLGPGLARRARPQTLRPWGSEGAVGWGGLPVSGWPAWTDGVRLVAVGRAPPYYPLATPMGASVAHPSPTDPSPKPTCC